MANLTFPKSALEPRPNLPVGHHEVMFKGFKPKLSKKKEGKEQSINLNPDIVIVNSSLTDKDNKPLNGQKLFDSLNLSFLPRLQDFCHAFGVMLDDDGADSVSLPGRFTGDANNPDPSKWGAYEGPLVNEIATVELAEEPSRKVGAKAGDTQVSIKRYLCRVPGCQVQHMESLLQS